MLKKTLGVLFVAGLFCVDLTVDVDDDALTSSSSTSSAGLQDELQRAILADTQYTNVTITLLNDITLSDDIASSAFSGSSSSNITAIDNPILLPVNSNSAFNTRSSNFIFNTMADGTGSFPSRAIIGGTSAGNENNFRGLFFYSGTSTVRNIEFRNLTAMGGFGAAGGGGLGAGGGAYVVTGAMVTLENVMFVGCNAIGGAILNNFSGGGGSINLPYRTTFSGSNASYAGAGFGGLPRVVSGSASRYYSGGAGMNGGSSANGGDFAGTVRSGIGVGGIGSFTSSVRPASGGKYAGAGGGLTVSFSLPRGGFGGGGASSTAGDSRGGFGGGGGAYSGGSGPGGFGAGNASGSSGGRGAALGGAIFMEYDSAVTLSGDVTFSNNVAKRGVNGIANVMLGRTLGQDIFMMSGFTLNIDTTGLIRIPSPIESNQGDETGELSPQVRTNGGLRVIRGSLVLSRANTYTGDTIISSPDATDVTATLFLSGTSTSIASDVTINNGGVLRGVGSVNALTAMGTVFSSGNITVNSGGAIHLNFPDSASSDNMSGVSGALIAQGDITFNTGIFLNIELDQAEALEAMGTININSGVSINLAFNLTPNQSQTIYFLDTQTVVGSFDGVAVGGAPAPGITFANNAIQVGNISAFVDSVTAALSYTSDLFLAPTATFDIPASQTTSFSGDLFSARNGAFLINLDAMATFNNSNFVQSETLGVTLEPATQATTALLTALGVHIGENGSLEIGVGSTSYTTSTIRSFPILQADTIREEYTPSNVIILSDIDPSSSQRSLDDATNLRYVELSLSQTSADVVFNIDRINTISSGTETYSGIVRSDILVSGGTLSGTFSTEESPFNTDGGTSVSGGNVTIEAGGTLSPGLVTYTDNTETYNTITIAGDLDLMGDYILHAGSNGISAH